MYSRMFANKIYIRNWQKMGGNKWINKYCIGALNILRHRKRKREEDKMECRESRRLITVISTV